MLAQRKFKPLPIPMVRKILREIGAALKFLHNRDVIHRDVKLENVMLANHSKTVKLADFGLAEKVSESAKLIKRAGTVGYAAPELLMDVPYDTSSDIWSLGCLLYAMLTVTLPFPMQKKPS